MKGMDKDFSWGAYFMLGTHMWRCPDDLFGGKMKGDAAQTAPDTGWFSRKYRTLQCDDGEWRAVTERMRAGGLNQIVIDIGEGLLFPSHPELAIDGSWTPDRMRDEVRRLRGMGIDPVPKLNFSAGHDVWLGEYHRMVSTRKYYEVCGEIIADVCEIFGGPKLFHIGFDEETAYNQRNFAYSVVRQGELWWHDVMYFVKEVERHRARAWMWSDYAWHHDDFCRRMSKGVLQSNWYYGKSFDMATHPHPEYIRTFIELEKAGFDQIPCGGNWSCDTNFRDLVAFCREHVSPERLKGFLTTSWHCLLPDSRKKNFDSVDQVAEERKKS